MKATRRIGMAGYACILRSLIDEPKSRAGVMERCDIRRNAADRILCSLHDMRVLRIAGWEMAYKRKPMPIYGFGNEPDAPQPVKRENGRPVEAAVRPAPQRPSELVAFVALLREIEDPTAAIDAAVAVGMQEHWVRTLLRAMHELRIVFIAAWWRRKFGPPVPLYQFGVDRADEKRPQPMGRYIRNGRYRKRVAARALNEQVIHSLARRQHQPEETTA